MGMIFILDTNMTSITIDPLNLKHLREMVRKAGSSLKQARENKEVVANAMHAATLHMNRTYSAESETVTRMQSMGLVVTTQNEFIKACVELELCITQLKTARLELAVAEHKRALNRN